MSSPIEKTAVTVVTTPEIPSSTIPSASTTSPAEPTGILGAGWEEIDAGPVAGRYRMAATWTDYGLFVFGGHDNYRLETPSNSLFYHDGYLYNPDTGWSALPEAGQELFEVGEARALGMGDAVLVYGHPRAQFSNHAAIFDLTTGHWEPVAPDFGNSLGPDTDLVWTGELIVAPTLGLAYDLESGVTTEMPMPTPSVYGESSPLRGYWTGSEVVVIGSGRAHTWVPGAPSWRQLPSPPVPDRARDSVWADGRLWVFNYQMAAAVLDVETEIWGRPGDLPLRFSECLPQAVAVGDTPAVRMCSGFAVWDNVDHNWYPLPLEDVGQGIHGSRDLVGADDAIYSVGGPTLRRFVIQRDGTGSIVPPHAVPIGVMQLSVPAGWELVSSFAPEQPADGTIAEDTTIGLVFESGDTTCQVTSTYAPEGWLPPFEATRIGGIAVGPAGELPGTAYWVHGFEDDEWGVLFAVPDSNGSDWVTIRCSSPNQESLTESASSFGYLWSPWDPPPERSASENRLVVGPGWEPLDAGPIEGRMQIAAAWTGEELFVWGGHDGSSPPTPNPAEFYQGAYLFEPETNTWRPTAPPPDDLCVLTESHVMRLDDQVLLRGLAHGPTGCQLAAVYSPATDTWTAVDSRFFVEVSFLSHLVWTGEWLAAPTAGLAYVPATGETIPIPVVPEAGSRVGSATWSHWTGDRIIALGVGDVYVLTPGDPSWTQYPGPSLRAAGRYSAWFEGGLFVVEYDNAAARFDLDEEEWLQPISLPLRAAECDAERLIAAAPQPIATACSGMAIWDGARGHWIPIPLDKLAGDSSQPVRVVGGDGIYSIGEQFLRFPMERLPDGSPADPPTIPIGVALLDLGEFRIRTTIGLSRAPYPDDSVGEWIAIALDGPEGLCHVTSTYLGPALKEPERAFSIGGLDVLVFDSPNVMTDWAIPTGLSDTVRIECESEDDALLLAQSLWLVP
jgi:hypothetical protein